MVLIFWLTLPPLLALSLIFLLRHLKLRRQFSAIPSPRSYPLLGHALIIKPNPQEAIDQIMGMANLFPNHPRVVTFWIGTVPTVMIYSASLVDVVFGSMDHLNKGISYEMLRPWLGNGLLTRCDLIYLF